MQINKIIVDQRHKEIIQHGSIKFPLQVYLDDLHKYDLGYINLHWHKEVQFSVVLEGEVQVKANDASVVLQAGEGIFINSEVLHSIKSTNSQNAVLFSIIVSPLIANVEHGLIYENYIYALVNCKAIPYIELRDTAWQKECICLLTSIYQLDQQKNFGYELLIISCLAQIWNHLVVDSREILISNSQIDLSINQQRINIMLNYIHTHFHESIRLVDIANSVNISTSECNRCFQKLIGMTPIEYLIQVRLEHAITLLIETNMSVVDIASNCGFNHLSYFGKVFKDYKGMSPTRFRNSNKKQLMHNH